MLEVAREPRVAAPGPGAGARRPARWAPWATAAALALLIAASYRLRSPLLDVGFWIDEGLSVGIADRPATEIPGTLRLDGSPPLYYLLLHYWMPVFGRSEVATHTLSLVLALACIPLSWWLAGRLFGTRAGWLAAVLATTNPFLTQYAQETRMYTLVVAIGMLSTAAFVAAFVFGRRAWLPVFVVALVAQLYTHNWTLFFAAATGLAWLLLVWMAAAGESRRQLLRDGVLAYAAVLLLYAAWVPSLLFQAAHTGAPWAKVPGPDLILDAFGRLLGFDAQHTLLLAAGAGFVAVLRPAFGRSRQRPPSADARAVIALFVIALGTFVIAWISSQVSPAWTLRYLAVGLPPLLLFAALGLARAGKLGLVGTAIVAVMCVLQDIPQSKSNVSTVAQAIAPSLRPGDLVVSTQPEQIPVASYYLPDGLRYATLWGPVDDTGVTDWRDGVERLERTSARRDFTPLVDRLEPGRRLVLLTPIVYDRARWSAPWTELVHYRTIEWEQAAGNDPRLRAVGRRPVSFTPPAPNPVEAVVFLRVGR